MDESEQWWIGLKPLYAENNGQENRQIFSRKHSGKWQYVYVITGDDGTFKTAVFLNGGKADVQD